MKTVRNSLNYQFPTKGEVNTAPSSTIPDQTMTMREILERYARGLPIEAGKVPIYEGDEDYIPDPRTLDLAERQQLKEQFTQELADYSRNVENAQRQETTVPPPPTDDTTTV